MRVKVKGFKVFKDRYGKQRCYHRATGVGLDLEKHPLGSSEFFAECARIAAINAMKVEKPGTLGLLISVYKKSPAWRELKPKSQEWYESGIAYLKPINDTPLIKFDSPLVVRIRDKAQTKKSWYFANIVKTTLSTLFSWGKERGYIDSNPAKDVRRVKRPKDLARANRPWTTPEYIAVLEASPSHFKPLIGVMLYTGADPIDTVLLLKSQYKGFAFDFNRKKTGNPVYKPIPSLLKTILETMPKHDADTLLANSFGKPWTKSGVDSVWHKLKKELEDKGVIQKGLTLKGLRHTYATILREIGESHRSIADALGDKSEAMGQHYSRDADIKSNAERTVKVFDKKHGIVKLNKKSVKL